MASLLWSAGPSAVSAQNVLIPNFWDPNERFIKPDLSQRPRLKFLTTTDFPPFNFIDRRKRLSGFNIELARAICAELDMLAKCQIQALPWDELEAALTAGEGDAIIAGVAIDVESRAKYDFSRVYLQIPGRFIARKDSDLAEPIYEGLFRKKVGVVAGSGHERHFQTTFGERSSNAYPTRQTAFNALRSGEVDAVFTDALSASFWLASPDGDCCGFVGGPYLSEENFGRGLAVAAAKGDADLIAGFDYALKSISDKGIFKELYLRYFPLGLF
ncbi:MAG: transporter substrate-binding domain-containing protein [Salaquimonas sp.]